MKNKAGNKLVYSGLITGCILSLVLLFSNIYPFGSVIHYSNLGIRNILFSLDIPGKNQEIHPSLTLVAIDNKTLSDKEAGGLGRWQEFQRSYYARVIDNLNAAWAIAIGVDVLFSEKADGDDILAKSLKSAGNVVLGSSIARKGNGEEEILSPTEELKKSAYSVGYFQPILDSTNDLVYSVAPQIRTKEQGTFEAFSVNILRKYLDTIYAQNTHILPDANDYFGYYRFHSGKHEYIPLSRSDRNEVLINYSPKWSSFPTLSFVDVYNNKFNPAQVKDKIILVWATATALHDEFFTPLGIMHGVVLHLNFINTILEQSFLTYVSPFTEYIVIGLLTLFLTLFLMYVENRIYQLVYSFIALTVGIFFYLIVFGISSKIFEYPTQIVMIVVMIAIAVTAYKYIYEERGKRLLKNTLSQYLAEDLVTSVLSNYEEVKLGGTKKEITVFFSDIAGFTTLSERMEPEELVRFLSIYLKEVSDIIMHERGFINKYEWDAVMAIWWAFMQEKSQSYLACKSALIQQEAITRMNEHFQKEFGFEISVRMGINKWLAVVGNIGSQGKKIEYTALGDTVNTASRLEGINKMYGTLICTGESVARDEREHFIFRKIDSIMVKGKDIPVNIYELIGAREKVAEHEIEKIAQFELALWLYQSRQFEDAQVIFKKLSEFYKDGPSITFLERTNEYLKNGCPADWQGHYRATEK